MKKVSLMLALVLGFAATSFAQSGLGSTKCAWGMEQSHGDDRVIIFNKITTHGIYDSEGESAYSVSVRADFKTNKSNEVYLIDNKTQKKLWLSQFTPAGKVLPAPCNSNLNVDVSNAMAYSSPMTKVVVYVSVQAEKDKSVYVFVRKPVDVKFTL